MNLNTESLAIERAAIDDLVEHENGKVIVDDERATIVGIDDWYKCVFDGVGTCAEYMDRLALKGDVCVMNMPRDASARLGLKSDVYRTYAYLKPMPPEPNRSVTVKRLAPTLAELVRDKYDNCASYSVKQIEDIMRNKGVFGAIVNNALAGFIGMHEDGNMGLLQVFEQFRRQGIGEALERFLISYIMTFGRVPLCDVSLKNEASISLQNKLGLTEANGYTFWFNL